MPNVITEYPITVGLCKWKEYSFKMIPISQHAVLFFVHCLLICIFSCLITVLVCYCSGNKEFDVNKDGVISAKEFRKAMEAQKVFTRCVVLFVHAQLLLPLNAGSPPSCA